MSLRSYCVFAIETEVPVFLSFDLTIGAGTCYEFCGTRVICEAPC